MMAELFLEVFCLPEILKALTVVLFHPGREADGCEGRGIVVDPNHRPILARVDGGRTGLRPVAPPSADGRVDPTKSTVAVGARNGHGSAWSCGNSGAPFVEGGSRGACLGWRFSYIRSGVSWNAFSSS